MGVYENTGKYKTYYPSKYIEDKGDFILTKTKMGDAIYNIVEGKVMAIGGSFKTSNVESDHATIEKNSEMRNDLADTKGQISTTNLRGIGYDEEKGLWLKNYIILQHFDKVSKNFIYSTYMNMLTIEVMTGDWVEGGAFLGTAGILKDPFKQSTDMTSLLPPALQKQAKERLSKVSIMFVDKNKYISPMDVLKGKALKDTGSYEEFLEEYKQTISNTVEDQGSTGTYAEGEQFAWPNTTKYITSPFGPRNISNGSKNHKGIDIRAKDHCNICASASGKVIFAGVQNGYGNCVQIQHINGFSTFYAHLSKIVTKKGASVELGELIGKSGNTGGNFPEHLHFEIRINEVKIDPLPYMPSDWTMTPSRSDYKCPPKLYGPGGGGVTSTGGGYDTSGKIDGQSYVYKFPNSIVTCYSDTGGTAGGVNASANGSIAAAHGIPYGTKIYIPSLKGRASATGIFVVQDTGAPVFDFDVNTNISLGKTQRDVFVLSWGKGKTAASFEYMRDYCIKKYNKDWYKQSAYLNYKGKFTTEHFKYKK